MLRKKILLFFIILIFTILTLTCNKANQDFMIIFWNPYKLDKDKFEDIRNMTYQELNDEYEKMSIILEDSIIKYYWDEQMVEVNMKLLSEKTRKDFIPGHLGLFSIVLNDEIILNGRNRTVILPNKSPDDKKDIPVIQCDGTYKTEKWFFLLKPKYQRMYLTFKDFNEEERERFLNQLNQIYDYFNLRGKIVRGTVDLSALLVDEMYWKFD